ncbi:hypothetical protein HY251_15210 [bacterium]|nr:hypothetical protein [bacterium]
MAKKKKAKPAKKPAAKKPAAKKPSAKTTSKGEITAKHVADLLGVKLTKPLDRDQILHLKKSLPGYAEQLDDSAKQLAKDAKKLGLVAVTPAALMKAHTEHKHLASLEQVAGTVFRAIHEQRLLVDDVAIGMLFQIARRVGAHSEDHPELLGNWKFLRDYLGHFRKGGGSSSDGGAGGKSSKGSSDAPPTDSGSPPASG